METIILFLLFSFVGVCRPNTDCRCGYGGFCLNNGYGDKIPCTKTLCSKVGKGFYDDDCNTITNHCLSSPCKEGRCIQTFGSYFCECPLDYFGQNCQHYRPELEDLGISSDVYVYYQVQTGPRGQKVDFHLVYDPGLQHEINTLEADGPKVTIKLEDGRHMYPTAATEFKLVDVKEKCTNEAEEYRDWQDIAVCDLLPSGEVLTYSFRTKFETTFYENVVTSPLNDEVKVGMFGYASIEIELMKKGEKDIDLFNANYRLFTYSFSRVLNPCVLTTFFIGCDVISQPEIVLRLNNIRIHPIVTIRPLESCTGIKKHSSSWFLQRNAVDEVGFQKPRMRDAESTHLPLYDNEPMLSLPPNYLPEGKHMIEYRLVFQGDPPHYGSPTTFDTYGRCWISVKMGPMLSQVKGGNFRTVSCFQPMKLELFSENPSYLSSEMSFAFKCNHTNDPECAETLSDFPYIQKLSTPCGQYYEYKIQAKHVLTTTTREEFTAVVHFVESDIVFTIQCSSNCYPIDPAHRVVLVAEMEPYLPSTISWVVTKEKTEIFDREPEIDAFFPSSSTRILRIDGSLLTGNSVSKTPVSIHASSDSRPLAAKISTVSCNLEMFINSIYMTEIGSGYILFNAYFAYEACYEPMKYKILQISRHLKDNLILLESNYMDRLIALPAWESVQMCIVDGSGSEACSILFSVSYTWPKPPATVEQINQLFESGEIIQFYDEIAYWMYKGVSSSNLFNWTIPPAERAAVFSNMLRYKSFEQRSVVTICHILSLAFYSRKGNLNEDLPPFIDEIDKLGTYSDLLDWIEMETTAFKVLSDTIKWAYQHSFNTAIAKLPRILIYGDILDGIFRCMSLAHVQSRLNEDWLPNVTIPNSFHDKLYGFLALHNQQLTINLYRIMLMFCKTLSRYTHLFYGIRNVGRKHARGWSLRSTYTGIRQSFNKSKTGENLTYYSNHIFGPVHYDELWLQHAMVELPDENFFSGKELCFAVLLINNRPGDKSVSPLLFMYMETASGQAITHLPNGASFNVTLPAVVNGEPVDDRKGQMFSDTLIRHLDPTLRHQDLYTYKFALPVAFKSWDLGLYVSINAPLKVKISFKSIPSFHEVENVEETNLKWIHSIYHYFVNIPFKPESGEILPEYFYVGLMLGDSVPYDLPIFLYTYTVMDLCEIVDPLERNPRRFCGGLAKQREGHRYLIDCVCNEFGFISGSTQTTRITKLMGEDIQIVVHPNFILWQHIMTIFAVILITGLLMIACFFDSRCRRQAILITAEDTYYKDHNPLLIGVYTGMKFMSGTRATLAIKITGLSHSSRVHLLTSKFRPTLQTATDDWFLIMTNQPLGKIASVTLWSNHQNLSSWYCRRIIVHDLAQGTWYVAEVGEWFQAYPLSNTSRLSVFTTSRLNPVDVRLRELPHKFQEHVLTEIRNSHYVASIFLLHRRCLHNHEERSAIAILKILSMFFVAWFAPRVLYRCLLSDPSKCDEREGLADEGIISMYHIEMCLLTVASSYIILAPFLMVFRFVHLARLVQRKVTNPLVLDAIKTSPNDLRRSTALGTLSIISSRAHSSKIVASNFDFTNEIRRARKSIRAKPPTTGIRWNSFYKFVFTPSQFHCVNLTRRNLRLKLRREVTGIRVLFAAAFLFSVAGIFYLEGYTNYWGKYSEHLFLLGLSVTTDVLIVNPLLILLSSIVACYVIKVTNREVYLWNDDTKVQPPHPLTELAYIKTALTNNYRPLTTSQLESMGELFMLKKGLESLIVAVYMIIYILIVGDLLNTKQDSDYFNTVVALKKLYSRGYNEIKQEYVSINDVICPEKLEPFLSATFIHLVSTWPGGKPISELNSNWCPDRISKLVGGASMHFTFSSTERPNNVPGFFVNYYTKPVGYLQDSKLQDKTVVLYRRALNYTDEKIRVQLIGRSKTVYKIAGQRVIVSSRNWKHYYVQIASIVIELVNRNSSTEVPRAFIFSTNNYNMFVRRIVTVDLLVEFLPSGLLTAHVNVFSLKVFDAKHVVGYVERCLLILMTAIYSCYVLLQISRWGLKNYVRTLMGSSEIAVLISGLIVSCSFFTCHLPKYPKMGEFFKAPAGKYVDLHSLYFWDTWDSIHAAIFLTLVCANLGILMMKMFGRKGVSEGIVNAFNVALVAELLTIIYASVGELCSRSVRNRPRFFIYANYHFRSIMPLKVDTVILPHFLFLVIGISFLSARFCSALFIHHFDRAYERLNSSGRKWNLMKWFSKEEERRSAYGRSHDTGLQLRLLKRHSKEPQLLPHEAAGERKLSVKTKKLDNKFGYLKGIWM